MDQLTSQAKPNPWFNPRFNSLQVDNGITSPIVYSSLSRGYIGRIFSQTFPGVSSTPVIVTTNINISTDMFGTAVDPQGIRVLSTPGWNHAFISANLNFRSTSGNTTLQWVILVNGVVPGACIPYTISATSAASYATSSVIDPSTGPGSVYSIGISCTPTADIEVLGCAMTFMQTSPYVSPSMAISPVPRIEEKKEEGKRPEAPPTKIPVRKPRAVRLIPRK